MCTCPFVLMFVWSRLEGRSSRLNICRRLSKMVHSLNCILKMITSTGHFGIDYTFSAVLAAIGDEIIHCLESNSSDQLVITDKVVVISVTCTRQLIRQ